MEPATAVLPEVPTTRTSEVIPASASRGASIRGAKRAPHTATRCSGQSRVQSYRQSTGSTNHNHITTKPNQGGPDYHDDGMAWGRRAEVRIFPGDALAPFFSEYPASTHLISSDLGGAEGDLGGLCFISEARASFRRLAPHSIVPAWSRFTLPPRRG